MRDSNALSAMLRSAIEKDGRSLNVIGRASGVDHGRLSRFIHGQRDLRLQSTEKLIEALGYEVRLVRRRQRRS